MKKFTKKSLAILIIAVMLSSFIPNLKSYAVDTPVVDITANGSHEVEAEVGNTVSVDLNLVSGLEGRDNFTIVVSYNPE